MEIGTFRGLITLALLVLFVVLVVVVFSRRRKADFDAAAQLPLGDDRRPPRKNVDEENAA